MADSEFQREERYLVLRLDDIYSALTNDMVYNLQHYVSLIEEYRVDQGKEGNPKFVCVKDTYPEYEYIWQKIEERMNEASKLEK